MNFKIGILNQIMFRTYSKIAKIVLWVFIFIYNIMGCQCRLRRTVCPVGRYLSDHALCLPCHRDCGMLGCSGPGNQLGPGGCTSCYVMAKRGPDDYYCINPFGCLDGHYLEIPPMGLSSNMDLSALAMCQPCHPECVHCYGPGSDRCQGCQNFSMEEFCLSSCPAGSVTNAQQRKCTFISSVTRDRVLQQHRLENS